MKRLLLFALFAVLAVACLGLLASSTLAAAIPANLLHVNPSPPPHGSHLVMNIRFLDIKGEDGGNVGYWAYLPATREHVKVWQIPDGSFYSIETMRGTWITYAGVPSSNCDPKTGLRSNRPTAAARSMAGSPGPSRESSSRVSTGSAGSRRSTRVARQPMSSWAGTARPQGQCRSATRVPGGSGTRTTSSMPAATPCRRRPTPNWGPGWEVYRYTCQTMIYNTAVSGTIGNIVVTK